MAEEDDSVFSGKEVGNTHESGCILDSGEVSEISELNTIDESCS